MALSMSDALCFKGFEGRLEVSSVALNLRGQPTRQRTRRVMLATALVVTATACASSGDRLLGRWWATDSDEALEFFRDGTVSLAGGLMSSAGSYKVIDERHIRVELG